MNRRFISNETVCRVAGEVKHEKLGIKRVSQKTKTNTKYRARENGRPGQVDFMIGKLTLSNLVHKASSHPFNEMKTKRIKILYHKK